MVEDEIYHTTIFGTLIVLLYQFSSVTLAVLNTTEMMALARLGEVYRVVTVTVLLSVLISLQLFVMEWQVGFHLWRLAPIPPQLLYAVIMGMQVLALLCYVGDSGAGTYPMVVFLSGLLLYAGMIAMVVPAALMPALTGLLVLANDVLLLWRYTTRCSPVLCVGWFRVFWHGTRLLQCLCVCLLVEAFRERMHIEAYSPFVRYSLFCVELTIVLDLMQLMRRRITFNTRCPRR